eukprot:TRINITY_DN94785_c0_g1_i1.p2 TRINITY_DN94785_c0_g1~~TRINITY_DN94785_c0_g1_i1.p2  ORF type:complete len:128 (+),score=32.40 TRINITY_DN94785_c0_g1_i1:67-450(+)
MSLRMVLAGVCLSMMGTADGAVLQHTRGGASVAHARLSANATWRTEQPHIHQGINMGDPEELPEQGYAGKDVSHENMKTATGDWGKEYGPTKAPPTVPPKPSGATAACSASLVSVVAMSVLVSSASI